jgi:hypothetical protein
VLETDPQVLSLLGKHLITKIRPQPTVIFDVSIVIFDKVHSDKAVTSAKEIKNGGILNSLLFRF